MRRTSPSTTPHPLFVAPTGRGKGVGLVMPDLLAFPGQVVVLDVRGESPREATRPGGQTDGAPEPLQ